VSVFDQFTEHRDLLVNLSLREIRGQYRRTALGRLWSLLNPIATLLIYSLVFGVFLGVDPGPGEPSGLNVFALWLMCALVPWNFFNAAVQRGAGSLVENANLVKKVYFPRELLVTAVVASGATTFAIEMVVLVVALLLFGGTPLLWVPAAVVVMLLLVAFALGLAWLLSVSTVYFRDTSHLLQLVMMFWFYATPIVYPLSLVATFSAEHTPQWLPVSLLQLYELNPMTRFVEVLRVLLYDNTWPPADDVAYCAGVAAVAFFGGYAVLARFRRRLAEEL